MFLRRVLSRAVATAASAWPQRAAFRHHHSGSNITATSVTPRFQRLPFFSAVMAVGGGAAVTLAVAEESKVDTAKKGTDGPTLASPFEYKALQDALAQRANAELALREYIRRSQERFQQLQAEYAENVRKESIEFARSVFLPKYNNLKQKVAADTLWIMYGVKEPHARQRYLDAYGCTKWTPEALKTIATYSPIVEIGAGSGHWQKALTQAGVEVAAYDDQTDPALTSSREPVGVVAPGNEEAIDKHPGHTLLLCYPPRGPMAERCLARYKGKVLLYVGEGNGGFNADPAFFAALGKDWRCVRIESVDPFPGGVEHLFVFERKSKSWFF